jgi:hypothetical protein
VAYYRGRKYRDNEVRAIVSHYQQVLADRDTDERGIRAIIASADITRAWPRLNRIQQRILMVHGVFNLDKFEAAQVLQKSPAWVTKNYRLSLERLTDIMNGDV